MKTINTRKISVLPVTLEPSTSYLVKDAVDVNLFDHFVSDSTGSSVRHTLNKADVTLMISTALSSLAAAVVVADIAARDALTPTVVTTALVLNATGDSTVTSGAATYVYNPATTTWTKISEAESLDVILQWMNIQGKPTSLVADIDDAVTKRHTHNNLLLLETIALDADTRLTVGGVVVAGGYLLEETW